MIVAFASAVMVPISLRLCHDAPDLNHPACIRCRRPSSRSATSSGSPRTAYGLGLARSSREQVVPEGKESRSYRSLDPRKSQDQLTRSAVEVAAGTPHADGQVLAAGKKGPNRPVT